MKMMAEEVTTEIDRKPVLHYRSGRVASKRAGRMSRKARKKAIERRMVREIAAALGMAHERAGARPAPKENE